MKNSLGKQLMQEEGIQDEMMGTELSDEMARKQAIANIRKEYGLSEYPTEDAASYLAQAIAKKQGVPMDIQAQREKAGDSLEQKLRQAGEMGMQGGMAMGGTANIGRFSNVATGLAREAQAAKQASNLMQLGAKEATVAPQAIGSAKPTTDIMKKMLAELEKRGVNVEGLAKPKKGI